MQPNRPTHNGDGWNRPNEGPPLSARWTWPTYYAAPLGALVVQGQMAAPTAQFSDAYMLDAVAGGIALSVQILGVPSEIELDLVQNPGPTFSGYSFYYNPAGPTMRIDKYVATVRTNIATVGGITIPSGGWIGGVMLGSAFTLWTRDSPESPWVRRANGTDMTLSGAFQPAIYMDGNVGLTTRFGPIYVTRADRRRRRRLHGVTPPIA